MTEKSPILTDDNFHSYAMAGVLKGAGLKDESPRIGRDVLQVLVMDKQERCDQIYTELSAYLSQTAGSAKRITDSGRAMIRFLRSLLGPRGHHLCDVSSLNYEMDLRGTKLVSLILLFLCDMDPVAIWDLLEQADPDFSTEFTRETIKEGR
ncbi:MAG TPA: hypothetical protein VF168_14495 [Trueperaceae bacterium]